MAIHKFVDGGVVYGEFGSCGNQDEVGFQQKQALSTNGLRRRRDRAAAGAVAHRGAHLNALDTSIAEVNFENS